MISAPANGVTASHKATAPRARLLTPFILNIGLMAVVYIHRQKQASKNLPLFYTRFLEEEFDNSSFPVIPFTTERIRPCGRCEKIHSY